MIKRIVEPEIMETINEAEDYDKVAKFYSFFMSKPVIDEVTKKCLALAQKDKEIKILDVGGGNGTVSIEIAKKNKFAKIYFIDGSENMLKIGKNNIEKENLQNRIIFVNANAKNIPFDKNLFDISFCSNMLHHQKNPEKVIEEMARVTKNNGFLIVWDFERPNYKFLLNFYSKFLGIFGSKLIRKEYYDSLASSLTTDEIKDVLNNLKINDFFLNKKFPHFFKLVIKNRRL